MEASFHLNLIVIIKLCICIYFALFVFVLNFHHFARAETAQTLRYIVLNQIRVLQLRVTNRMHFNHMTTGSEHTFGRFTITTTQSRTNRAPPHTPITTSFFFFFSRVFSYFYVSLFLLFAAS